MKYYLTVEIDVNQPIHVGVGAHCVMNHLLQEYLQGMYQKSMAGHSDVPVMHVSVDMQSAQFCKHKEIFMRLLQE